MASTQISQSDSVAADAAESGAQPTIAASYSLETIAAAQSQQGTKSTAAAGAEPDAPEDAAANEDLWSSILNSVQSSRGVPTKNIVVLGEHLRDKLTSSSIV